jgi:hypothetical protein
MCAGGSVGSRMRAHSQTNVPSPNLGLHIWSEEDKAHVSLLRLLSMALE